MNWPAASDFLGRAYLRYSFTKGTEQEADFLVSTLGLAAGTRILDVGCGPGRHAHALARRGMVVHGIDISSRFIELAQEDAPAGATFEVADARTITFEREFDVVMTLCQGGFGLVGAEDAVVLENMARAVKPDGRVVFSAFSAYFAVRFLEEGDEFDADRGVNRENTTLKNEQGDEIQMPLETTCYTPRELRLLCERTGLAVEHLWSVLPGAYAPRPPNLDSTEFLVVALPLAGPNSL